MKYKCILLVATFDNDLNFELFSQSLYRLDPKPDLVIFAENNSEDNGFTLKNVNNFKLPHELIRVWFREDITTYMKTLHDDRYIGIAHIRELLLTRARHYNPECVIFLDDDTLPPRNLITKLSEHKQDIVGGVYYRDFPEGHYIASKFFYPYHIENNPYMKPTKYLLTGHDFLIDLINPNVHHITDMQIGDKISYIYNYVRKRLIEAPLTSAGCLYLSRKVLQDKRLHFYPNEYRYIGDKTEFSEDFGFCYQARNLGYKVWVDLFCICRHLIDMNTHMKFWSVDKDNNPVIP